MAKIYGYRTEDIKRMVKDKLIDETMTALTEYDPDEDDGTAFIASIGAMFLITDKIIKELDREEDETNGEQ